MASGANTPVRAPQHRHQRARRAALRQKSGDAEQHRPSGGDDKVRAVVEALGLRYCRRRRSGRREQRVDIHLHRPVGHHRHGKESGDRYGRRRRLGAPRNGDRSDGEDDEGGERDRIVPARQHQERRGQQIDRKRKRRERIDLARSRPGDHRENHRPGTRRRARSLRAR